jgi:hypothetical protein
MTTWVVARLQHDQDREYAEPDQSKDEGHAVPRQQAPCPRRAARLRAFFAGMGPVRLATL